jgi:hypothetical protein
MEGRTTDGWTLSLQVAPNPTVQIWKEGPDRDASIQTFLNEPCVFSRAEEPLAFLCSASGKSPLAGTRYVGRPVDGDCDKGEPAYEYVCTIGCDENLRAPRVLTQGYWEC